VAERAVKQFAETVETIEKASEEAVLKSRAVRIVSGMRIMRAAGLMAIVSMPKNSELLTMDDIIPFLEDASHVHEELHVYQVVPYDGAWYISRSMEGIPRTVRKQVAESVKDNSLLQSIPRGLPYTEDGEMLYILCR